MWCTEKHTGLLTVPVPRGLFRHNYKDFLTVRHFGHCFAKLQDITTTSVQLEPKPTTGSVQTQPVYMCAYVLALVCVGVCVCVGVSVY